MNGMFNDIILWSYITCLFVENIKEGDHFPKKSAIKHHFPYGVMLILGELNECSHSGTG